MADNVDVSEGSGKTVAADDVGGVMYQRVKIAVGGDGEATDISAVDPLPVEGIVTFDPLVVSTATITTVDSSASSVQILAENTARVGFSCVNTDSYAVLIKFGTTASSTSYTIRLTQNSFYEMPSPVYTGRIDAIWEGNGDGALIVTEL